ncbi:unnamed protein product [Psylliodes chrysocephalus]|uniref:CCHC-type domain-containing protein n=1 Tax=Psylliodes chrysocephalus TaxID=3402493 RepID=A0A9P0D9L8_9CUCU|nr:unnamed protein product [Psylliodes chrysocephala]
MEDEIFGSPDGEEINKLESDIKALEGAANIPRRDSIKRTPPKQTPFQRSFSISDPQSNEAAQASQDSLENAKKRDRDTDAESPEARNLKSLKIQLTKDQEEMAKQAKLMEKMIRKEKEAMEKKEKEEKERQARIEKSKKTNEENSESVGSKLASATQGAGSSVVQVSIKPNHQPANDNQTRRDHTATQTTIQRTNDNMKTLKQTIKEAVTRTTPEGRGKIAFSLKEQRAVLNGLDEITNIYTDLLTLLIIQETEINKLQSENNFLKEHRPKPNDTGDILKTLQTEIQKISQASNKKEQTKPTTTALEQTPPTQTPLAQNTYTDFPPLGQRTYAQLTKRTVTKDNTKEQKQWTTPEPIKKFDTIIKMKEGETGNTLTELKKLIKPKDIEGTTIRHTRTAIVLTSESKDKQNEIIKRTQTSKTLDIKDGTRQNEPTAILTGLRKAMTHEELTDALKTENDDLERLFGDRLQLITTVSTRPCRNPYKENVYIKGPSDIVKHLLKSGKVYIDFQTIYINEATQVALCLRCCRYGHVSKYCRETTPTCYKCGDGHDGNACDKDIYNCINCERLRLQPRGHQARDTNCPIYDKKMDEARSQTVYR